MVSRINLDISFGYGFLMFLLIHVLFSGYIPFGSNGFTMKLIPRVNIDEVLFPKNLSLLEKHHRIVQLSRTRALNFRSFTNTTPEALQPKITTVLTGIYVIQMMVGTKPYSTYLLFDSGADDAWLQCDGCVNCFPLRGGSFKYHESRTYKEVSCNDPLCVPKICSPTGMCLYHIQYMGGAISKGSLSTENFTFPDKQGFVSFQGAVFGCGFDNRNIEFGGPLKSDNVIAGVFGIDAAPRSFLRQLAHATNMRFSYCLASHTAQVPYSYLHFGPDAKISGAFKTTPLVSQGLPRYYVACTGISLSGIKLPINPALFKLKPDGSGGFAFDTGTGPTVLVKSAYQVLKAHVTAYFEQYHWYPIRGKKLPYDLCYKNLRGIPFPKPSMTFHFQGGVDLVVDPKLVFQHFDDRQKDMFCLSVMPMDNDKGPNILGAFQQIDYRFLFDVQKYTVSFAPEICSHR